MYLQEEGPWWQKPQLKLRQGSSTFGEEGARTAGGGRVLDAEEAGKRAH